MAAKKIIFLIDKSAGSFRTLSFAARYFERKNVSLTFVTPFTGDEKGTLKSPSDLLRYMIPSAVSAGLMSGTQLHETVKLLAGVKAQVIALNPKNEEECKRSFTMLLKYSDLMVSQSSALQYWNLQSIDHSVISGLLNITLLSGVSEMFINRIVVLNDGSDQSIKTIKEFSRLMNNTFSEVELNLLSTNSQGKANEDLFLIRFLKAHFHNIAFYPLTGEEPDKLRRYLEIDDQTLILNTENTNTSLVEKYFIRDNVATLSNIN